METLIPYFQRAVAEAAQACRPWIGKGNKDAADQAAVTALRARLGAAPLSGTVVIGEGERDQAPMLHIGETLGIGGPAVDIAVDPLEGTTFCAQGQPGALCVAAFARPGGLLHAPDVYMHKLAVGADIPLEPEDLDRPLPDLLARVARFRDAPLRIAVLDRPRHRDIIAQLKDQNVRLTLLPGGDLMACLQTALRLPEHKQAVSKPPSPATLTKPALPVDDVNPLDDQGAKDRQKAFEPAFDLYLGSGGAPEGVLAAAGLQALGGRLVGRLALETDSQQRYAQRLGIKDGNRVYTIEDLADPKSTLVLAGVTGHVLQTVTPETVDVLTINASGVHRENIDLESYGP